LGGQRQGPRTGPAHSAHLPLRESWTSRQMSRSSRTVTSSSCLPRLSRCSLILTAVSCITAWVSWLPPTSTKFLPRVRRVWPSSLSKAKPSRAADFRGCREALNGMTLLGIAAQAGWEGGVLRTGHVHCTQNRSECQDLFRMNGWLEEFLARRKTPRWGN
jgi:hypothetical protein